ncbi:hypothetical protein AB0887_29280 [Streptomyces huasconensis]|uniref:Serine/threonine protein kinase n=1 Tax=Streptomyces huasconensis TaxID=1854574 RepID=A0ABV3M2T5_9ACTN
MNAPPSAGRTVGLVVGAVLVIAGAVFATIAVFGGSTAPGPDSSRPPSAQPSKPTKSAKLPNPADKSETAGPSTAPSPEASCLLYDFECQAEGGSAVVTRQPPVPPSRTGR